MMTYAQISVSVNHRQQSLTGLHSPARSEYAITKLEHYKVEIMVNTHLSLFSLKISYLNGLHSLELVFGKI